MIWLVVALGSLVATLLLMTVIGTRLRPEHVCARTVVVAGSPAAVWTAVTDVSGYPRWRRDVKRIDVIDPTSYREHGGRGAIRFVVEREDPPTASAPGRRVTRIADDGLPFGGRWLVRVVAEGDGTRVTVTEDGFVKNPLFRFLSRTVFSLASTQERWLIDLSRHIGGEATPAPAEPEPDRAAVS